MKKYFLLILLSLLFYNLADAQFTMESFPIDQFKLPDIDRQAMEVAGNLLGDFNTQHNRYSGNNFTSSEFEPSLGLLYTRYINRKDLQAYYEANTHPYFSFYKKTNEFDDNGEKSTTIRPDLSFAGQWSKYKEYNFSQIGIESSLDYDQYHRVETEAGLEDKRHGHFFSADLSIPVGIGKGRLEPVSDMAMAFFLLNDITKAGVDGATISPDQVNGFASRMAELRNERVFDTREKRIYELRELYSFMESQQWIIDNDPGFFTILTDNWLYNNNVFRQSGKKWTYSFIPSYKYSDTNQSLNDMDIFKAHFQSVSGALQVLFEKYKPVNVHHDIFRTHTLHTDITQTFNPPNGNQDDIYLDAVLSTVIGHQWIPNSRTTVITSLGFDYHYIRSLSATLFRDDDIFNTLLRGVANYFISYRTRLFADFIMSYNYTSSGYFTAVKTNPYLFEEFNSGFHVRLNGGITVSIF